MLQRASSTDRLRVLSMNTHVASELMTDAGWAVIDWSGNDEVLECRAIVKQIRTLDKTSGGFDVIALQEVWTDAGIDCFTGYLAESGFIYHAGKLVSDGLDFEEDAGLLILSRLPFEKLPLDPFVSGRGAYPKRYAGPNGNGEAYAKWYARGAVYQHAAGIDALAGKGLLHVRVKKGEASYDVITTHLQAPASDHATRAAQIVELSDYIHQDIPDTSTDLNNEVIVVGDLNIQGLYSSFGCHGNHERCDNLIGSEYDKQIRHRLGKSSQFFDAWLTSAPYDPGVTAPIDQKRLDYALYQGPGYADSQGNLLSTPLNSKYLYPQWIRTVLHDAGSDHTGVAIEVGPAGTHVSPRFAKLVSAAEIADIISLEKPGTNFWYEISKPGTYSIGLQQEAIELGLRADVFSFDDLSAPLSHAPMFSESKQTLPRCGGGYGCTMVTNTYLGGSKPLYVRIHDPQGLAFGDVRVSIKRHDCSSIDSICEPRPGGELQGINLSPYSIRRRESYFYIRTLPTADQRDYPTYPITLIVNDISKSDYVSFKLDYLLGPQSSTVVRSEVVDKVRFRRTINVAAGSHIRVTAMPSKPGMRWKFGWETDATVITDPNVRGVDQFGDRIFHTSAFCESETSGLGSDEATLEFLADGVRVGYQYHDDLDANESISQIAMKQKAFLGGVTMIAKEYIGDENGVVESVGSSSVGTLSSSQEEQKNVETIVVADGLKLRVRYGLTHSVIP